MRKLLILFMLVCSPAWAGIDVDGTDDFASCGNAETLQENAAITISAWINPDTDHIGSIVSRRNDPAGGNVRFAVSSTVAKSLRFSVAGGVQLEQVSVANSITTGAWQHVLVTWTGSTTASNAYLYVNGTEVTYATTTNGSSLIDNTGGVLRIGNTYPTFNYFNGKITEVAIWSEVLDSHEIEKLALSRTKRIPLQIRPSTLIGYWPIDNLADGAAAHAGTFINYKAPGTHDCTGDDGANNTGMTALAEAVLSYP